MDIFLSINNREQVIQLPIVPPGIEIELPNRTETFDTVSAGELLLLGLRGLKSLTVETFFPNKEYDFARSKVYTGDQFVVMIEQWIDRRMPIRFIMTSTAGEALVNLAMGIESFSYNIDAAGDVAYTLTLKEFRFPA